MVGEKRERPLGNCIKCRKEKPIYTHLNGDKETPLCGACNMRLRRESTSNDQAKALKQGTALIGTLESLLGLPIERRHRDELLTMQDRIKILMRIWLGDESAEAVEDMFAAESESAASPESDNDFSPEPPAQNPWFSMTRNEQKQFAAERLRATLAAKPAEAEQSLLSNTTELQPTLPN